MSHDVKAVYQKYLGWNDANPANLNPLPPVEAGRKYVEYMGGVQSVMERARQDFANGEYRWVAQVMNSVVFAYPDNQEARDLEADALEQLGYQAEAATWRNSYLMSAYELWNGVVPQQRARGGDTATAMTMPMYFDYLGVRLNGSKADGKHIVLNWNFTDVGERYVLNLENSALTYMPGKLTSDADAPLIPARATLDTISAGETTFDKEIASGNVRIQGDIRKLAELMAMLDIFETDFNIVTP